MLIKIVGMVMVVGASSAIGLYLSGLDSFRIHDLQAFKQALLMLESTIDFMSAPLPEAIGQIARRTAPPVAGLLTDFAAGLTDGEDTAYQIWLNALDKHKPQSYLDSEDWEALASFGKTLGYLDKQMQLNAIRFTVGYIENTVTRLQAGCDKNKRMYRSLGVVGGLLLAIIFI